MKAHATPYSALSRGAHLMQNDKSATSVNITKRKIENKNYAEGGKTEKRRKSEKRKKENRKKKKSQDVAGLNKSTRIMHFLAVNKNKVTRTSSRD